MRRQRRAASWIVAIPAALCIMGVAASCARDEESRTASAVDVPATELSLGRPATAAQIAALDLDVNPAGVGLPAGGATALSGAPVYAAKCARCHGEKGEGVAPSPALVGRIPGDSFPFGADPKLVKTVGNYWPYATTLYDYVRRSMPIDAPGSLTPDEIYGVVAVVLAENRIIEPTMMVDATTLPKIRMPARDRFVPDDRRGPAVRQEPD